MRRFFERGGAWVMAQGVMMCSVVLLAVFFRGEEFGPLIVAAGAVLLLVGAVVALAGALALGRNLTPFPKPGVRVRLVRHGVYAVIRHPLYSSVISCSIGWSLVWQSWPALVPASALIPFFHAKARHEERWLRAMFPEYAGYETEVRRFVPWL